jgi:hypothetical protein
VRLNEGNDTINLTKSEAQITAILTRRNTRKNKGAALSVPDRLVKWRADVEVLGKDGATPDPKDVAGNTKRVGWTATICYLDQATGKHGVAPLVDASQNSAEPEPLEPMTAGQPARATRSTRSSTPRLRKVRGLGATNGTPAKEVLSSTILPDELAEDTLIQDVPKPEPKKRVDISSTSKNQKSRIPPPRKLNLNPSVKSVASAVKEDTLRLFATGSGAAGGKKQGSMLPVTGRVSTAKKASRKADA